MPSVPLHYIPNSLSSRKKSIQKREIYKSRDMYKRGIYHTRKFIKGYTNRKSKWDARIRHIYNIPKTSTLGINMLSKKTGCSKKSLQDIVRKGMGAYYSSGSRPNQTPHSWGYARLYSALSGGPASVVDKHIIKRGCPYKSKVLNLANSFRNNLRQNNPGQYKSRQRKTYIGGYKMRERIERFEKSPIDGKKYRAYVKNIKTHKKRHIDFGGDDYQQYKDRTGLELYSHKNHGTRKRMRNYFNRHSGTPIRSKAIEKEKIASKGLYNPKILSHEYLW